ncbi:helix-turn-helix transcriptional regulator [Agromyces lapidis]|uniref:helix-turn-helix transcriptional regulator n=1 Tax=Agromyces lapidis TaxID=279574 RepID=UPI0012F8F6F6|nr:WYL domain-containing protein [Agromyces lapidis]
MRADRLVATLLVMQARGRVTARQLADELEISVATARRDLEALSAAGIPVYPQPGRGGGWRLLGEGRTDLSGFTASEARALFLLLGPRAGESEAARSALRKVLRALPATFRADAEAAAEAVIVDSGGWDAPASRPPRAVELLQQAVLERRVARFAYTRWGGEAAMRRVRPLGLIETRGIWYLIADVVGDHGAEAPVGEGVPVDARRRSYRVDRMADVVVEDERFERSAPFDLDAEWAALRAAANTARHRAEATVLVDAGVAEEFRGWVTGSSADGDAEADGRVRLRVSAPSEQVLERRLAAWASEAEVVEPASLRDRLAGLGAALAARYG